MTIFQPLTLESTLIVYKVAIKILKHRNVKSLRDFAMIEREKKALVTLDHPHIVKLKEILEDEVKEATYLVFEYVSGGELFGYITSQGRLNDFTARKFMRQVGPSEKNIYVSESTSNMLLRI